MPRSIHLATMATMCLFTIPSLSPPLLSTASRGPLNFAQRTVPTTMCAQVWIVSHKRAINCMLNDHSEVSVCVLDFEVKQLSDRFHSQVEVIENSPMVAWLMRERETIKDKRRWRVAFRGFLPLHSVKCGNKSPNRRARILVQCLSREVTGSSIGLLWQSILSDWPHRTFQWLFCQQFFHSQFVVSNHTLVANAARRVSARAIIYCIHHRPPERNAHSLIDFLFGLSLVCIYSPCLLLGLVFAWNCPFVQ